MRSEEHDAPLWDLQEPGLDRRPALSPPQVCAEGRPPAAQGAFVRRALAPARTGTLGDVSIFEGPLVHRRALYYPFAIPPDAWIKQALLFNDSFSSVLFPNAPDDPEPYIPEESRDLFEWLRGERLWRPIVSDVITYADYEDLAEAGWPADYPPPENENERRRIYSLDYLAQVQVATYMLLAYRERPAPVGNDWRFDRFMADAEAHRLAKVHSFGDVRTVPETDDPDHYTMRHSPGEGESGGWCREVLLDGIYPRPHDSVPFSDVVSFKAAYADELLEFQVALDALVEGAAADERPVERMQAQRMDIERAVRQIEKASRGRKMRLLGGSVTVLATGVVGLQIPSETAQWVFSGFGVAAAAAVGSRLVGREARTAAPYSYLIRAHRQFT